MTDPMSEPGAERREWESWSKAIPLADRVTPEQVVRLADAALAEAEAENKALRKERDLARVKLDAVLRCLPFGSWLSDAANHAMELVTEYFVETGKVADDERP